MGNIKKIIMKSDEQVVAVASRIEFEDSTGKLFIVFEITDEKYKRKIMKTWSNDIEFRLIDKSLVLEKEK